MKEKVSEMPMKKYKLAVDYIEAIEVTARYVNSLENMGKVFARFGEQVEILLPGPAKKKIYAQPGEFIICFQDMNGGDTFAVVSYSAFKGMFREEEETEGHGADVYSDPKTSQPSSPPVPPEPAERQTIINEHVTGGITVGTDDKLSPTGTTTEAEKKALAKESRLQELSNIDTSELEKPLGSEAAKA